MFFGGPTYTFIHVVISLAGIVSGLVALFGLLSGELLAGWTFIFLATTVATSVTGFGFPSRHLLPSHVVGILSLVVLALALYALYGRHLAGGWRNTYVICAVMALYFNVFVAIVQAFQKVPALKALAPTQSEAPFKLAQGAVLVLFVVLGILAVRHFHSAPVPDRLIGTATAGSRTAGLVSPAWRPCV